jgi:hypothetical protein
MICQRSYTDRFGNEFLTSVLASRVRLYSFLFHAGFIGYPAESVGNFLAKSE